MCGGAGGGCGGVVVTADPVPHNAETVYTCDWPMGTVWSGPRRCGRKANYRVSSGPMPNDVRHVCGVHDVKLTRLGGGSECLHPDSSEATT